MPRLRIWEADEYGFELLRFSSFLLKMCELLRDLESIVGSDRRLGCEHSHERHDESNRCELPGIMRPTGPEMKRDAHGGGNEWRHVRRSATRLPSQYAVGDCTTRVNREGPNRPFVRSVRLRRVSEYTRAQKRSDGGERKRRSPKEPLLRPVRIRPTFKAERLEGSGATMSVGVS